MALGQAQHEILDPLATLAIPPRPYQFIIQRDGNGACNVGWYYIQNAAPDGPVAWMIAQVPDRFLRCVRGREGGSARSRGDLKVPDRFLRCVREKEGGSARSRGGLEVSDRFLR